MSIFSQIQGPRRGSVFIALGTTLLTVFFAIWIGYDLASRGSKDHSTRTSIRIGLLGHPSDLNIFQVRDVNAHRVLSAGHLGLVRVNHSGVIRAGAAERWVVDKLKNQVIFYLRRDLYFYDGTQFHCDHVIDSFHRAFKSKKSNIETFEAACASASKLIISNFWSLSALFNTLALTEYSIVLNPWEDKNQIQRGLGPYQLTTVNEKGYFFLRRTNHPLSRDEDPEEIRFFVFNSEKDLHAAFLAGEIDITQISLGGGVPSALTSSLRVSSLVDRRWQISIGDRGL